VAKKTTAWQASYRKFGDVDRAEAVTP